MKTPVAAIVGPTAAGKTALAVEVAELLDAEIVSVDSMQIYRGMDIGTAKPTVEETERVPHHLLDMFEPSHDVSVMEFQELARNAIAGISARGRQPMLVGGSGLYYRAVVDELSFPPRDPEVRTRLEADAERMGPEALHTRLTELDPAAAAKMEPSNARRAIRALEVIEITGRPFSSNDSWDSYESIYELAGIGLSLERDLLFERIAARVDEMIARGLVGEARAVSEKGLGRTAGQALGYRQILDQGVAPVHVRDAIVKATKRFARRQESWFRADPRLEWLDASDPALAYKAVAYFKRCLRLP